MLSAAELDAGAAVGGVRRKKMVGLMGGGCPPSGLAEVAAPAAGLSRPLLPFPSLRSVTPLAVRRGVAAKPEGESVVRLPVRR